VVLTVAQLVQPLSNPPPFEPPCPGGLCVGLCVLNPHSIHRTIPRRSWPHTPILGTRSISPTSALLAIHSRHSRLPVSSTQPRLFLALSAPRSRHLPRHISLF
jgi:hypothetical protein